MFTGFSPLKEYSTFGGISAYTFLLINPSATSVFNVSERTFGKISGFFYCRPVNIVFSEYLRDDIVPVLAWSQAGDRLELGAEIGKGIESRLI